MVMSSGNCDNCFNRHITSVATHWCSFCSEGLCSSCTEHHQASKVLKSHSLLPISDYQKLPHYIRDIKNCCETHAEPFQLYCRTHEQCCCLSCVKESHRKCEEIEALNVVIQEVKSSTALEEIETSLKTIIDVYDNFRENRMENKARLPTQKGQIITQIQSTRKNINDHLDKLVNAIETTISTEFEAANLKIDELLSEIEDRKNKIRQLIEKEEAIKELSTDLQLFLGLPYFQDRIKEEAEFIENLKREHRTDELDLVFQPNNHLDSFCEDNDSLGKVSISQGLTLVDFHIGKKEIAQIIVSQDGLYHKHVSDIHQIQYHNRHSGTTITGCTILPSGQILYVDQTNNELVMRSGSSVLDNDYRTVIHLSGILDVTVIDDSKAAVTINNDKKVVIVDFLMGKEIKTFSLDDKCWGIEYTKGNILIKCPNVFLLMDVQSGNIVKNINTSCQTCVTVFDEKIFGCRHTEGIVYCLDIKGDKLWQFQDEQLKCPRDVTIDLQGFVYVTGMQSNNVIVISPDGKTCKEILNKSHGLNAPTAIHFEKTLGLLLVCNEKEGAVVCNIK